MSPDEPAHTIPLLAEQVHITKQDVVSDRLRVTTSVEERSVVVEDVVERGQLQIERIAVDRAVAQAPEPRHDGDTLIVSVVEERLVVEKRLFVIEELRITRTSTTTPVTLAETVRTMRATVEHTDVSTTGNTIDG